MDFHGITNHRCTSQQGKRRKYKTREENWREKNCHGRKSKGPAIFLITDNKWYDVGSGSGKRSSDGYNRSKIRANSHSVESAAAVRSTIECREWRRRERERERRGRERVGERVLAEATTGYGSFSGLGACPFYAQERFTLSREDHTRLITR